MEPSNRNIEMGSRHLGRLFMQFKQLERHPRVFGEAGPLTPSEIHTIDAISCESGILMSELAARLSVTKGAVSQIVKKLESKQLVQRTPHPEDSRAVMISLTEKGIIAFQAHRELHQNFYKELSDQLNQDEIQIFEKCIQKLTELLKKE
ncbi:MarR family winged helix-turn-helix transcriptional regulator [Chengkuizengella axinellae]|uniref:MarR family transcriptional regulator n=1 Tax=Chengkuizengella axinellae TaxID=3064388 RepID=A0ABT9IYW9_9BACL|nr:MarR family transcriptional regulator [Chengkuizengella sp. 2205SS18-9]MDP5274552.1 MarR family transcriptional regulator [Chengkuizengella sp. 2205SS18-9]